MISVIIPTYNRRDTIKRCVDSVLGQTYRDFEIIIVDDCSTDGTMDYIDDLYGAVTDINITYVRNDRNLGPAASRNVGVSYASGEYLAFHDSDDEWMRDKLEKQMIRLEMSGEGTGAVYCAFETRKGKEVSVYPPVYTSYELKNGFVFPTMLIHSLIGMITLVVRRDIFVSIGGFQEQLSSLEDYELSLRIAANCDIAYVDEVLAVAYESENSVNKRGNDKILTQCYIMNLYKETLRELGLKRRKFDMVYGESCMYGNRDWFLDCLLKLSTDADYIAYVQEKRKELYPVALPEQVASEDISGVDKCTGCMACCQICPSEAIGMEEDGEGFLRPVINSSKCIRCGQCKSVCPVCNENVGTPLPDECYAVMASAEVRKKSSSGGVFRVLARQVLAEGGYVAGAVWNEKHEVMHILSDRAEDIERMGSSKYVQSMTGESYQRTRDILQEGKKVLFTGCACQLAGLKRYLGKDYENLLLADVVCHGVPSQKAFVSHMGDMNGVEEVSFRKKEIFGWSSGIYRQETDGSKAVAAEEDAYMFGFLNSWMLRPSCYDCHFKGRQYSDITMGDFWGIGRIPELDDGLGTSFVTLNTTKGACFFKNVLGQFEKVMGLSTDFARQYNPCIAESVKLPKCRELFFREWKNCDIATAVQRVKDSLRFDIALVVMWAPNYGNALTNYALYEYLDRKMQENASKLLNEGGKPAHRIVVLDNFCPLRPVKQFAGFAGKHYALSSEYFPDGDYAMLNECCESFVVGSDQSWNYSYEPVFGYGKYFQLDFANADKRKTSYGTSFGQPEAALAAEEGRELYQRFHAVSVRERFGVDICSSMYGVEAECVLDPVFLLEKEDYDVLTDSVKTREQESYILAYILNPTREKRELCLKIQEQMGGTKIINIIDANQQYIDYNMKMLEYDNIRMDLSVEEWLWYVKHSEFIITDSYHGTCFSMIYGKRFVTVRSREASRFDTFAQFGEVYGRIVEEGELGEMSGKLSQDSARESIKRFLEEIDYEVVNTLVDAEKERSKRFVEMKVL